MANVAAGTRGVDGESLVPLLQHDRPPRRTALYWHYPHYHQPPAQPSGAIRSGDFKLIEFYEDERVELYDLKNDPGENHDLVSTMPEKAAELRQRLRHWLRDVDAQMPCPNPDYKPSPGGIDLDTAADT